MSESTLFSRRSLITRAGQLSLSAGALALLAGNESLAGKHAMRGRQ